MHHAGNGMLTSAYIGDVSAVCYVKALVIITLHSNVRAWLGQVTLFTSSLALYIQEKYFNPPSWENKEQRRGAHH